MDESTEDNLETNWVFVEEVDIAEEALTLNPNKEILREADEVSQDSFENLSKSISKSDSDSQFNEDDNLYKCLDKQNTDQDSESDELSIISNWSYSQGTPDENLNDDADNKENYEHFDENIENNGQAIQKEDEAVQNDVNEETKGSVDQEKQNGTDSQDIIVEDEFSHKIIENVEDNVESDLEVPEKDGVVCPEENEVDENPDLPERSFPMLSEERILQYEPDLLDQLKWLDEPPEGIDDTAKEPMYQKYILSKIPQCIKKNFSVTSFLIGTVLIAASSVFLGRYFTATETIQEELPTYQENVFLYDVPNEENFDVPTALSFCREKHKSNDIYMEINAQKCLSKIEKRMKRKKNEKLFKEKVNSWEKHLEAKEKFLNEKENGLKKREAQFKSKNKNYENNGEFEGNFQHKIIKSHNKDDSKEKSYKDDKKRDKSVEDDSKNKHFKHKNKEKNSGDNFKEKKHKGDGKNINKYMETGGNYKKKDAELHGIKARDDLKYSQTDYKRKNREYSFKEKSSKEDKKKHSERLIETDHSCRNNKNECKNIKNRYKQKFETNFLIVEKKNETVDGNWLGKLFKGRGDIRNKENSGEWYFDRSSYRKRKRDKAKWYFDWMMDREVLRYRRLYLNL